MVLCVDADDDFKVFKAEAAFDEVLEPYRIRADKIMVGMNLFLMVVCLGLAPIRDTYIDALVIGIPTLYLSYLLMTLRPGALLTRLYMACAFMAYTGLIIHQTGGDIEGHFSAFGLVGVLLYYRDWRTILAATIFIYFHHLILGYVQTLGVLIYVFDDDRFWLLFGIHVAYFLPFIVMMMYLSIWLRREGYEAQRVINLAQQIVQGNLVKAERLEQHEFEQPLIKSVLSMKDRLLDLLRVMPVPAIVIRVDTSQVVSVNQAWKRVLGPIDDFNENFNLSSIWTQNDTWNNLLEKLEQQGDNLIEREEVVLRSTTGKNILCELSLILHNTSNPVMAIMTVQDITERRKAEKTMKNLAFNDLLTALPNRSRLQLVLGELFSDWRACQKSFCLAVFDLDEFKPVNDTYGHDAGDEVLKAVAARFNSVKREEDMIARLGGDEFVLLMNGMSNISEAISISERFIRVLDEPIHLRGRDMQVKVGLSVGVAVVQLNDQDVDSILKRADQALYQAKKSGKNQVFGSNNAE